MEFFKFFWQIGLVGKLILFGLLFMSLASWYYIFLNLFIFKGFSDSLIFWQEKLEGFKELTPFIQEVKNSDEERLSLSFREYLTRFVEVYNFYFQEGVKGGLNFKAEAERELEEIALNEQERLLLDLGRGLGFLATTASIAPFIGLFGTVWGIMKAFHEIGLKGSASLATVAPGIAEALINTAMGLFVAIPAAIAYNFFMLRREKLAKELELLYKKIVILSKREFLKK